MTDMVPGMIKPTDEMRSIEHQHPRSLLAFHPNRTALLVIDMQHDYCSYEGALARTNNLTVERMDQMLARLPKFIDTVRDTGTPVIFLRMIEDPDYMLSNGAEKIRSFDRPIILCSPKTIGFDYFGLSPVSEDIQIVKNSYDAFLTQEGSELLRRKGIVTDRLEDVLKALAVDVLLFSGVLTSRCVDSTLRGAFQRGYRCIVAEDMVAVPDQLWYEHDATLNVWRTIFAYVGNSNDILALSSKD